MGARPAWIVLVCLAAPAGAEPPPAATMASVVERVAPAVVNISATRRVKKSSDDLPFGLAPFGDGEARERVVHGVGSGVIVSGEGLILTNNHVVEDASDVRVSLPDRREFRAKVVGTDPPSDLAVIKISARGLPSIRFGDSGAVKVGDFALAVGNPFGLGQTVTYGIISAVGRGDIGIVDYEDFLQTDAAINPGNSGGALVNMQGELIGINTALLSGGSPGNQGIGFAVPTTMARAVLDQILKNGKVVRGWLGVVLQEITPAMAQVLGLSDAGGALVGDVSTGSPAERAGLKRGDVIRKFNSKPVLTSSGLRMQIAELRPGARVTLAVQRGDRSVDLTAKLGELPKKEAAPAKKAPARPESLGLDVGPITPGVASELELPPGTRGVVVTDVEPDSRAGEAGLKTGDVIQEANRHTVQRAKDLTDELSRSRARGVMLLVLRNGTTRYVLLPAD